MNGQNALIVSIGVLVGFVAGLVASKLTAGSNSNQKVRRKLLSSMGYIITIYEISLSYMTFIDYIINNI